MLSSFANAPAAAQGTAVRRFARVLVPGVFVLSASAAACSATDRAEPTPAFRENVAGVFQAKCVECHSGDAPAGGWRATTYMDVIGCVGSDGSAATEPRSDGLTPIAHAIASRSHNEGLPIVKRLSDDERTAITRWLDAGAPAWRSAVHPPGFVDPRSKNHHSKFLRARNWQPMLDAKYAVGTADKNGNVDPDDPGACGQCHAGLSDAATPGSPDPTDPARPVRSFAPNATACTSCHNKPGGIFNCTTCHGSGDKPYALRDACFHPPGKDDPTELATPTRVSNHEAHLVGGGKFMNGALQCTACHALPGGADVMNGLHGGTHGNGQIDVLVAEGVGGAGAKWDPATKACTNRCHSGPGAARTTTWSFDSADKAKCGDCHGTPPPSAIHPYKAPDSTSSCGFCHKEVAVAADGTTLSIKQPFKLHMDGKIEVGDGSGTCSACHGVAGSGKPDPSSGAHTAHLNPKLRKDPIPCTTCHVVPTATDKHPLGDGHGHVAFSGLAVSGGFPAQPYDPVTKSCSVYCHSAIPADKTLPVTNQTPKWTDGAKGSACGACHGVPPPAHFTFGTCGIGTCHGGILTPDSTSDAGVAFTEAGLGVHVNGAIDPRLP
jgi:predicted CxxxxCH...CXXCH cytochrome family protein